MARYGRPRKTLEIRAYEFGEEFSPAPGFAARLLPAGHIFGSAQIHLTRLSDGATLLYTGDFKTRPGLSCERCEAREAGTLIMETTFGLPRYRFPPPEEIHAQIARFAKETLEAGGVPAILGYSLGKAQEILAALGAAGIPAMQHDAVAQMSAVYRRHLDCVPAAAALDPANAAGHAVVVPPHLTRTGDFHKIPRRRTAMVTGWALDPSAKYRFRVDEAFPLSDHADYDDLLAYVEAVRPQRVLTLHGYAGEFAADLRNRGVEAWSLEGPDQLELGLGMDEAFDWAREW